MNVMKDYSSLIAQHKINVNFNPATVHIWMADGKLKSQNHHITIKLSTVGGDEQKALQLAIDKLLDHEEHHE